MKKNNNKQNLNDVVIDGYRNEVSTQFDPNGSWTGVPADKNDKPVQDADDL